MTTVIFSAAGAAIGGSIGGTFAGLSSVVIGRAVGATLGRVVDQRLLGQGGRAVETGKVDRFRLTGAGEGDPVAQVHGRMRLGGHVIWASDFREEVQVTGGGKGAPPAPRTSTYSYTVSLAVALCEGEITGVGRIWADGEEIARDDLNLRVYTGTGDQMPDALMEAVEGAGRVPAYRGIAYVVMEDLPLANFGNRVPQFSFEVLRAEEPAVQEIEDSPAHGISAVALIPGTGEYTLATTPVTYEDGAQAAWSANVNTPQGRSDFEVTLETLQREVPSVRAASLVVSWFGSDLRCGACALRPKVEDAEIDGANMPWRVSGLTRATAEVIAQEAGRPVYGGTPADASVVEAIRAMNAQGTAVMFYPFILMDQLAGNTLPNPYSDSPGQPALPWRGRITLSVAPGRAGSPDGTAAAEAEVDAFFGTVRASDFTIGDGTVAYHGPEEWSLSRFILHYAALCAAAGGVEAFCIGSELRGLTQIRAEAHRFVAVARLRALAAEVRTLVGPQTQLSYAADWSEYFGYHPQDGSGDVFFHLDPLWADPEIDFVGIDNYMPLSDWREGRDHLDARTHAAIYDLAYLRGNIEGGEGYAWYYPDAQAREAQRRVPITDGAYGEDWVYRYKDLRNWWQSPHHDRIGGVRQTEPTGWLPMSKPIRFTEYGCAAVDKATNQPNKFLDGKSSESDLPHFSDGGRDELIQHQYLRAMIGYWRDPARNPVSPLYDGPMVDMDRAYVWAWDVRPFPFFPNNRDLWSDGTSYARGHWLNGRVTARTLAGVVAEICSEAGVTAFETSGLFGLVRGYLVEGGGDARRALQPLMLRYGFDAVEREGVLRFVLRKDQTPVPLDPAMLAVSTEMDGITIETREAEAEISGRVRLRFVEADGSFDVIAEEAVLPDEATHAVATSELNMALTRGEGRQLAERWLLEARAARETARLALPPSRMDLGAGDVIVLPPSAEEGQALYRIDRVERSEVQIVDAVRIEPDVYDPAVMPEEPPAIRPFVPPLPVTPLFLDLPLLRGDEVPHAPHLAASAPRWPGTVACYQGTEDAAYRLNTLLPARSVIGFTRTELTRARAGVFDPGPALEVELVAGALASAPVEALLSGANLAAVGDGSSGRWEVLQFAEAELIAPGRYLLRQRLRGQAGSDGIMPAVWPAGSRFVLLNGTPRQIELSPHLRRVAQDFRIGPADRPLQNPSYRHLVEAFDGNGLRPYAPCHLAVRKDDTGAYDASWIRRSRIGGDDWAGPEVPLGEESEAYLVRVRAGGSILREEVVETPAWRYDLDALGTDAPPLPFQISVAQISALYGPGPEITATVGG